MTILEIVGLLRRILQEAKCIGKCVRQRGLLLAAGNGLIDFEEFCEMMESRLSTLQSSPGADQLGNDFRSLFMAFDKDNNGYIDGEELRQTMSAVGLQLSDRDVSMMMKAAGVPSGGRIYYEGESATLTAVCRVIENYNFVNF